MTMTIDDLIAKAKTCHCGGVRGSKQCSGKKGEPRVTKNGGACGKVRHEVVCVKACCAWAVGRLLPL